jgi:hypothetical protein
MFAVHRKNAHLQKFCKYGQNLEKNLTAILRHNNRLGVISTMSSIARSYLLVVVFAGLCSCVHRPTKHVEREDWKTFVYVAAVHNVPLDGEPRPNAWHHVRDILNGAGIRNFMESSSGVASISVEPNRSREAVELLRKDAAARGYWIEIARLFR